MKKFQKKVQQNKQKTYTIQLESNKITETLKVWPRYTIMLVKLPNTSFLCKILCTHSLHSHKNKTKQKSNLLVTSENEITISPIHQFKVLHKSQRPFKPLFNIVFIGVLFITV